MIKKESSLKFSTVILLVLLLISIVFIVLVETGAFKISKSNNKTVKYNTLNEAISKVNFNVQLPNMITNDVNAEYRVTNGSFLEIGSETFVLKASKLVDFNADPLALYEKTTEDYKYTVENSNISYFRYRLNYPEFENCTIMNWVQGDTAYGIILSSIYKEEELLNILGITKDNIKVFNTENIDKTDITYNRTLIANKFTVDIPKFTTEFKTVDLDGKTICYIDNTKVFIFIYNDYDIDTDTFGGQSEIIIDDKMVLRYLSENPFENGSSAYNDYNIFIDTVNDIVNSIKYQ